MKLIKDLGTIYATPSSKRRNRYGIYECPVCNNHLRFITNSVNSGHTTKCRSCSTKKMAKKIIDDFDFKLTPDSINDLFTYVDGELLFRKRISLRVRIGDVAGGFNNAGYRKVKIKRNTYSVHRLIWIMHNGITDLDIDHIDHNPSNNNIKNLRLVTHKQNCQNRKLRKDNTSGFNGVMFNKSKNKWEVYLSQEYIGAYLTKDEAILKRKEINKNSGYHKNHGKDNVC